MDRQRLQRTACCSLLVLVVVLAACSKPAKQIAIENVDYWTCAMHPSVHSATPGKCPICGMDLVPVPKGKAANVHYSGPSEFVVPVQRQQQIGVTYTEARKRPMWVELRSVGTLEVDQSQIFECVTGVDGYVEELRVTSAGEHVTKGEPLMVIRSSDLRSPEQELINLLKVQENGNTPPASMDQLIESARRRLLLLNMDPQEIANLESTHQQTDSLLIRSPANGIVSDAPMKVGTSVKRGDELMRVVNLSHLWLWANFYENEIGLLKEGEAVTVAFPALQGQSFDGKISVISPTIDPFKRTGLVRIDISNADGMLRPGMFADVVARIYEGEGLTVPVDAVLPLGSRMLVFLDKGSGKLQPRFIEVSRQVSGSDGPNHERYYQVTGGLRESDRIVSSANFLIDAEAQIQGAVSDFGEEKTPVLGR